jgi:hypothetical protein
MNALSLPKILGTIRPKPFLLPFAIFTFAAIRLDSARAQETASQNAVSSAETVQHQFVYHSSTKRNSVAVAGTFNNWDKTANPLVSDASGTTWRTSLRLAKGKHLYKFVLDGETWITDPGQAGKENDGNGNINSVLFLTPSDYRRPASPVDGITAQSALLHLTSLPYLNADGGWLSLSLRARPNDLKRVSLKVGSRRYPMTIEARDEIYARYFTRIAWDRTQDLAYTFELVDGDTTRALGVNGLFSIKFSRTDLLMVIRPMIRLMFSHGRRNQRASADWAVMYRASGSTCLIWRNSVSRQFTSLLFFNHLPIIATMPKTTP